MTLSDRIKYLSAVHGSLRKAADAVGVNYAYLSRLASGEKTKPSAAVLDKLGLVAVTTYYVKG